MFNVAGGILLALLILALLPFILVELPTLLKYVMYGVVAAFAIPFFILLPWAAFAGARDRRRQEDERRQSRIEEKLEQTERSQERAKKKKQEEDRAKRRAWMDRVWKAEYLTPWERHLIQKHCYGQAQLDRKPEEAELVFDKKLFPELRRAAIRIGLVKQGEVDAAMKDLESARKEEIRVPEEMFRKCLAFASPKVSVGGALPQKSTLRSLGFIDSFDDVITEPLSNLHEAWEKANKKLQDRCSKKGFKRLNSEERLIYRDKELFSKACKSKSQLKKVLAQGQLADADIHEVFLACLRNGWNI